MSAQIPLVEHICNHPQQLLWALGQLLSTVAQGAPDLRQKIQEPLDESLLTLTSFKLNFKLVHF